MADRTVKVTLQAVVADYVANMRKARTSTDEVGGAGAETAKKLAQQKEAMETVGRAGVAFGTIIAAGVAVAIAKFAEFDAQMSNVEAATGETTANMDLLRQAAIEAGASTVFSATEAAAAIEELAKAGVSTADILSGALAGSLDLAAAGQLGVARAAEITSTALNQFELSGDQASHVADVLAAGAGKAMGSVEDLANGLKFVGPVAASMGVSLEETTGVLALFAQQGIIGEQAGTSLRGVLASLTSPSAQARGEIEKLGLTLYDSQGNFLGLQNAAGQLSNAYSKMDGASRDASLGVIFGRETVTAATALYKAGAGGVQEWTAAVDDSGFAAEQARKRLDNLKGDLEALQGALDTALIQSGSVANETLRSLTQTLTGLVGMFTELPAPIQGAVLVIGGATAAVTLAGGAALLAVPKFLEMRAAVTNAGLSMGGIGLKAGAAGLALAGLMVIVGEVAARQAEARAKAQAYADTLESGTNQITSATRRMVRENLAAKDSFLWMESDSTFDAATKLGISLGLVEDAAAGDAVALKELKAQLGEVQFGTQAFNDRLAESGLTLAQYQSAVQDVSNGVAGETGSIEEAIRVAEQKQEADRASAETSGTTAEAYIATADAASSLNDQLNDLITAINDTNNAQLSAREANRQYLETLAQFDEALAANGVSLDLNTEAGRENEANLDAIAEAAMATAKASIDAGGGYAAYRESLESSRGALLQRINDLGITGDAALALADKILRIPTEREFEMVANTASATRTIEDFKNRYGTIQGVINYRAVTTDGAVGGRAAGGWIPGAPSHSDNVLVPMATGEFVTRTREAQKPENRLWLEHMNAGGRMPAFGRGYAAGGYVQPQYASSSPVIRVSAPAAAAPQFPSTMVLEVDGQQFTAYVKGAAGDVVRGASSRTSGRR